MTTDPGRVTSIRTILLLMAVGTAVYVLGLGAYAAFELAPSAMALSSSARTLAQEYDSLRTRTDALESVFDQVELLSAGGGSVPANRTRIDSLLVTIRGLAETSAGVQASMLLSGIPPEMRAALAEVAASESRLAGVLHEALEDLAVGDTRAAAVWAEEARSARPALATRLNGAQRLGLADIAQRQRELGTRARRIVVAVGVWALVGFVLAALAMRLMHRRLFVPLRQLDKGLARVAGGDLAASLLVRRADEMGRLKAHFNEMTEELRRRPEVEALRASEVRFRSLIEHGMDLISIMGPDGRITYSSPAIERILGYAPEELDGQNGFDYLHPDDRSPMMEILEQAVRGDAQDIRPEFRLRHKDGSWRFFESVVTNLVDEPTVAGLVVNSRDITERKEAELALQQSQENLARIFQLAPVAISLSRLSDGRLLDVNDEFVTLLGYPRDELIQQTTEEVGIWVDPADRRDVVRAVAESGHLDHRELHFRGQDGRVLDIRASFQRMEIEGRELLLGGYTDITARREAERKLRESETRFRTVFMTGPDAYLIARRADGRIVEVNDQFTTMYGFRRDEALGRTPAELGLWVDPESHERLLAKLADEGHVENWEVTSRRKGGETFPVLYSMRELPTGESPLVMGVIRDVSEQKRAAEALRLLEEQFRQAQRLEAVGRLAGGVAHDFNNMLTTISACSDLLLTELGPEDPNRGEVEEIKKATRRAATLTRQLLAFSRKDVVRPRVMDLNVVIRSLQKMLPRLLGEDVEVNLRLTRKLDAVRADPGQIEQVIVNLAVNARDAMPEGGRMTIGTADLEVDEAHADEHVGVPPGRYVVLTVADTGLGIDPETLQYIFEPFFTTKEMGKGTGLGLATVHGIVTQSGGHVRVDTRPGQGTTFTIYLPPVDEVPESSSDAVSTAEEVSGGDETLLLVEDDPGVRRVASQVLAKKGYQVLEAPDGETAMSLARAHPEEIQLLVTDLVMPGIPGRMLADHLIEARPGIRVLYMSGYSDDAAIRHGIVEDRLPFLQKPFTPVTLAAKVREVLDEA